MKYFNKDIFMDFSVVYMNRTVVDQNGTLKKGMDDIVQLANMMHKYNQIVAKLDAADSGAFVWGKNPFDTIEMGMADLLELRKAKAEVLRKKIFFLNQKCRELTGQNFIQVYVSPKADAVPFADEFCKRIFVPGAAI